MDLLDWAGERSEFLSSFLGAMPPVESWWNIAPEARDLAFSLHKRQTRFGAPLPYAVHLIDTAMLSFAAWHFDGKPSNPEDLLAAAWLHDSVEDQKATLEVLSSVARPAAVSAIYALTKNEALPKELAMRDSLDRILADPDLSAIGKLSDRSSNLLDPPPAKWSPAKVSSYREESLLILDALGYYSPYLSSVLSIAARRYGSDPIPGASSSETAIRAPRP